MTASPAAPAAAAAVVSAAAAAAAAALLRNPVAPCPELLLLLQQLIRVHPTGFGSTARPVAPLASPLSAWEGSAQTSLHAATCTARRKPNTLSVQQR
jgi:hypothetical protein